MQNKLSFPTCNLLLSTLFLYSFLSTRLLGAYGSSLKVQLEILSLSPIYSQHTVFKGPCRGVLTEERDRGKEIWGWGFWRWRRGPWTCWSFPHNDFSLGIHLLRVTIAILQELELCRETLKALRGRLPSAVFGDLQAGALSSLLPASKLQLALHLLLRWLGIWWELREPRKAKRSRSPATHIASGGLLAVVFLEGS